jgi:Transglycosylase SLT domain
MTTLNQLLYGIRQIESSGRYSVVNSIGAVGAYQVMKANIPEWTRQALGHSMTWQQFRDSPSAQDAVARYKLGQYYNKYGAAGAAAMWFSGSPNINSNASDGGNTVRQYVNKVLSAAGGGSISGSSGGGGGDYTPAAPKLSMEELASEFGMTSSFLNANPELKSLFQQSIANGWSKDMFQAKLQNTKWWKNHSDKERQYLTQLYTDPATAKQTFAQAQVQVQQLAAQLGIKLTTFTKQKLSEAEYNVVAKGWNDAQLRYFLGQYVYFPTSDYKGQGADVIDEVRSYAYSMGVTMSSQWYADNTRKVLRGLATTSDMKNQIQAQAEAAFPQYKKQLGGGQTLADIAQPYLQSMAQILELPAGSVNLFDPTIKKALQYKDPGTLQNTTKPMWQFENDLRDDPRWKQTKNAQDSLMQVGHQVLSDFGFKY